MKKPAAWMTPDGVTAITSLYADAMRAQGYGDKLKGAIPLYTADDSPSAIGWRRPDGTLHAGCPPINEPEGWTPVYDGPSAGQPQPVPGAVWVDGDVALVQKGMENAHCEYRGAERLYFAPPATAEPPQPVASMWRYRGHDHFASHGVLRLEEKAAPIPLYAAPPAAAPSDALRVLRELVTLEADGRHADERSVEVWERARAVVDGAAREGR